MVVSALLVFIKKEGLICDETLSIRSCSWFILPAALTDEGRLFFFPTWNILLPLKELEGGRVHWLSIEYNTHGFFLAKNNTFSIS